MKKILASLLLSSFLLIPATALAETSSITDTGPGSENSVTTTENTTCTTDNTNDVDIDNSNDQSAGSGDASSEDNTTSGDSQSGDATNDNDTNVDVDISNDEACNPSTTTEQPSNNSNGSTGTVLGTSTVQNVATLPYTGGASGIITIGLSFIALGVATYSYTLLSSATRRNAAIWTNPCL